MKGFFAGIFSYIRALKIISKHRLWSYFLLPGLISILLGGLIFSTAYGFSDDIGNLLVEWYPWEYGKVAILEAGTWLSGLLIGALGLILYKNIVIMVAAPFMSPLSEKVEEIITGENYGSNFRARSFVRDLWRGVRIGIRNIVRELFFTGLLLIIGLFPLFTIFTPFLIFTIQAYYAGFGNMDYTLERHYNVRHSIDFGRDNRGLAIGNGSIFLLLLFTGIGFLIAPPLATVAATLETVKRLD